MIPIHLDMKPLGFISNGISSALIDSGSIVWLPLPRFDSPSIFGKLLDEEGGEFSIFPLEEFSTSVSYLAPNILSTKFYTKLGNAEIIDVMPLGESSIIRSIKTDIPLVMKINPVFYYGLYRSVVKDEKEGTRFLNPKSRECLALFVENSKRIGTHEWEILPKSSIVYLVYSPDYLYGPFHKGKELKRDLERSFNFTLNHWKNKVSDKNNDELRKIYYTSIGVLLGLMYSPTGAPVAAPTTSLPEAVQLSRNWDYRFTWVRDSSMISEGLLYAGYVIEARRVINFILGLVNFTTKPLVHPLYTIDGGDPPPEIEIPWLSGFMSSYPVRVGNGAAAQIQLDIEGFLLDVIYKYYLKSGDRVFLEENWEKIKYIADWISKNWKLRDAGMWEERGKTMHYTHSKVMMWVALDRAEKISVELGKDITWPEKNKLREWIFSNCVKDGSFVKTSESTDVDANLLTLPLYDFIGVNDQIFRNTLKRIENELYINGYVKRYVKDFLGQALHPFTLAGIWLSRIYIRIGKIDDAIRLIKNAYLPSNGLYLAGEHIDIIKKEYTGNYPQAFVHAQTILAINELDNSKIG